MKYMLRNMYVLLFFCSAQTLAQDLTNVSKQQPVKVSGSLDVRTVVYSVHGIPERRKPFSYVISGAPVISLYGLQLPFSFIYSEQQRSFSQPFNQFGLSPSYKWATVHGGYRNVSFSPYTLDGYTMLGAGLELHPGNLKIGFMYGRLNRATTIDTTTGAVQPFSFSRKGMAMRVRYGNEKSFIDFSFLKAKDDSNSVKVNPKEADKVRPAGNAVLSAAGKITIAKRFFIQGDGAASMYTNDIGSALTFSDSVHRIPVISDVITINGTSSYALAYTGAAGYAQGSFSLKAEYKHIDPGFQSMGAYFFNSDLESYSLVTGFAVWQSKLRFNGSIGLQKDNLSNQKEATSKRVIGMANISWQVNTRLGMDLNYSNFSSHATPTVVQVQNKYLLAQTNHNLSFNPRYIITGAATTQVILVSYNLAALVDANDDTKASNNITTNVIFTNYSITFNKRNMTISTGLNRTINTLQAGTINNYGMSLGIQKSFARKWQLGTTNSYTKSNTLQGNSTILNLGLQSMYRAAKHHAFSVRAGMTGNYPQNNTTAPRFTETTGEAGYTFSF